MDGWLDTYTDIVGRDVISQLRELTSKITGLKVVHVNSTKTGGGVAEILTKMVPLQAELGLETRWEVITGQEDFYKCTKSFHNALQGNRVEIPPPLLEVYEETNRRCAEELREILESADIVFIHDPQPAPLLRFCPNRKGKWIWRCHIDSSHPYRPIWKYLQPFLEGFDASIFSLSAFARRLPHPQYLIPPSIDPLSDKNIDLADDQVQDVFRRFELDAGRPLVLQVSRFDRFKDPVGVIQAYHLAKNYVPDLQLVLAGGGASDDPEGEAVRLETEAFAKGDPDIHILELPADAHLTINALQRASDIVIQKSIKEGFGLTVTEAMWKGKPVIGGDTGGIRLQVVDGHTGFLVNTPEGAALRLRYLLTHGNLIKEMGHQAKEFVRQNFLITRQLREYLTVILALVYRAEDRVEL
ncbi:MAG: glycosyltransferase [Thermodesulfobacteriota bacterium]